ncbi:MAG: S8 family serine peptidase [Verrucomicrobiales bacterium]
MREPPAPAPSSRTWVTPDQARAAAAEGDGEGVRVAVIDSGVEVGHPMLAGLRLADDLAIVPDPAGRGFAVEEGGGEDAFGHGTAVAGIIYKNAPAAEIGSFRVFRAQTQSAKVAAISKAMGLAIRCGYHVINCSWGVHANPETLRRAKAWVDEAYLRGVHLVCACQHPDPAEQRLPAHFTSVISVNMAPGADGAEPFLFRSDSLVEFAAPGSAVEVPWKGGVTVRDTGCSFAAPFVTSLVARILSVYPGIPPLHMIDLLHRIASPWIGDGEVSA